MMVDRGGHVGHINPALHNLNYPGMRDRQHQPHQRQVTVTYKDFILKYMDGLIEISKDGTS